MAYTSCTKGTKIIKVEATKAQPRLSVVHTMNPIWLMTSMLNIEPGHTQTNKTVKRRPAI